MTHEYTLPLADRRANLETVGGKGASLARLSQAELPVPGGFHITTAAYRRFIVANDLQPRILAALTQADPAMPATLEAASQAIRALFAGAEMPADIATTIVQAYGELPGLNPAVAVRSSATAEDLPEASFAGQQETYLNVSGAGAVLEATVKCWASLWTARAIGYRRRQGIAPEGVALAVVVQLLVPAEAAGILFTANPIDGRRDRVVISAAWGLGEAVVGGLVTPDAITMDKATGRELGRETADKRTMTVRVNGGTREEPVPENLRRVPVLDSEHAAELSHLAVRIEALYGMPMDIEWALSDGAFAIVQARPITALPDAVAAAPIEWKPPNPKGQYLRASVVDLMPDPLSPLFISMGLPGLIAGTIRVGRVLTRAEPMLPSDYFTEINGYAYLSGAFTLRGWWWMLTGMVPAYPRMLRQGIPIWRDEVRPQYQHTVARWQEAALDRLPAGELWGAICEIVDAATYYVGTLMYATMGASAGSEGLLCKLYEKMVHRPGDPLGTALLMGYDTIPARAEKSLYDLAAWCRERPNLAALLLATPADELAARLANDERVEGVSAADWQALREQFDRHLKQFGHIVFELDFAKPLPLDHPAPMLEAVKMYLAGEGTDPYERQRASEERRIQTTRMALSRLKGPQRWLFRKALNWAQSLAAVREDALADIGLGYPLLRDMLRELGHRLVEAGMIRQPADIFWLRREEVEAGVAGLERATPIKSLAERVSERQAFWQQAKRLTPPPMVPLRKRFMGLKVDAWIPASEGSQTGNTLKGVATSAGRVTAPACVIHGPEDFDRMKPGAVLVAGTTTPAWTPLFAMASAVVTDIGGPLSHGSIVAREYGIPAVMGTGVATKRITSGQTITVDGSAGVVTLA